MYSFYGRLKQLLIIDSIRLCKIIEIFQYSFVFLLFTMFSVFLLNKYYYGPQDFISEKNVQKKKNTFLKAFGILFFDVFFIIIIFFFIRKLALLFPSIATIIYPKFKGLTTLEYIIHIALVVVLIESLPKFKEKIIDIGKIMNPSSFSSIH